MTQATPADSTNSITSTTRLGENHGYRFDGDFVHLNAEVFYSDTDLSSGKAWALQLWASERGFTGLELAGIKVGEIAVQPSAGLVTAMACCSATPPAGVAEQVLGLALLAYADDGQTEVRDLAVYPARASFPQPRLLGDVACTLADGEAVLTVAAIANPRAADNLSGTLALEVWALDAPYAEGKPSGQPVASLVLGILAGGNQWTDCHFAVPAAPANKNAALTVMLREWTPTGYLTRDYRELPAAPADAETSVGEPTSDAPSSETETAPELAPVAEEPAAKKKKGADKTAKKSAQKNAKAATPPVAQQEVLPVSVNTASEEALTAVKGISASLAHAIVAARPFATLDELTRAKGLGNKMLAKLRDQLTL